MTDITKCTNKLCPLAKTCFRFTAKDGYWQSYADFKYKETTSGVVCDNYYRMWSDNGNNNKD